MAFEYIKIDDPTFVATSRERNEQDYLIVKCNDYSKVPIKIPNWTPQPICLSNGYPTVAQTIKDMEVRPDDVWLLTYPKSGTTWTQEMVWLICNNLNYAQAREVNLFERFPFLELSGLRTLPKGFDPLKHAIEMPSPRFIKSHLPPAFLPNALWSVKPKVVHVRRNPKAVAVSYYHHSVSLHNYKGTLDEFIQSMLNELVYYSPYHRHIIEYNELDYDNMITLNYEDMKSDLKDTIKRVSEFFHRSYSVDQMAQLLQHLSFDSMKTNDAVNARYWVKLNLTDTGRADRIDEQNMQFIRKGEPYGWQQELSEQQIIDIDQWTDRMVPDEKYRMLFQ